MPSADQLLSHADFSFDELVQAYFDCRRHKRNTRSALAFELNLEHELTRLDADLRTGRYRRGSSIVFVITRPKPREVWAAEFRDRVVDQLLHNHVAPRFLAGFVADTCACIPGRGTLYAAERLEHHVRSITQNWSRPAFYLKCDIANFFVSIDKRILAGLLDAKIHEPWWRELAHLVLFNDPRRGAWIQSDERRLALIPPHKSLFNQPTYLGLPIGNLSSQFFANVYMNPLDQVVKHQVGARYYVRYVDDFILLHESPQWLNAARAMIEKTLADRLHLRLNSSKTVLQPVARGVDFAGQVIRPWSRTIRRRVVNVALERAARVPDLYVTGNSYFGLFRQASHSVGDRRRLARIARRRGYTVDLSLTKAFRRRLR